MIDGVYQRTNCDCGAGAIATLLGVPYEVVADAWISALGHPPKQSSYKALIKILDHLGVKAKKVTSTKRGIRRVRDKAGARHSHWVVVNGEYLWCPTIGASTVSDYDWQYFGHGIEIAE